jgi:hypothetical protein
MDQTATRYLLCWIENGQLARCGHSHLTIAEATDCMGILGAFVKAVSRGKERALTPQEAKIFRAHVQRKRQAKRIAGAIDCPVHVDLNFQIPNKNTKHVSIRAACASEELPFRIHRMFQERYALPLMEIRERQKHP